MGQEKVINNRQFGSITIDMSKVVTFPDGILGFEEVRDYAIVDFEDYEPFQWLIAIDAPDVLFPIISPILVKQDYSPPLTKPSVSQIGDFKDEDLLIYVIVTIKPEGKAVTANLKGPLIINQKTRLGQQVILETDQYSLVEPVV